MKKIYQEVSIEVLYFTTADIVTLSENFHDDTADDIFAPNG